MNYLITFASTTGNTQELAQAIRETLPPEDCINFGPTIMMSKKDIAAAQRIYVGFWTNRGACSETVAEFLQGLENKEVFLFGTAGFGESQDYFDGILARVGENIPESSRIVGTYMCQGKMPQRTRERYEGMLTDPEQEANARQMLENFDKALSHPDATDIENLKQAIKKVQ
ncbi:MAG: flavodoxin family protein [Raoultibacter sp.]